MVCGLPGVDVLAAVLIFVLIVIVFLMGEMLYRLALLRQRRDRRTWLRALAMVAVVAAALGGVYWFLTD